MAQRPKHWQARLWTSTHGNSTMEECPCPVQSPTDEGTGLSSYSNAQKPPQQQQQHPLPKTRGPLGQCSTHTELPAVPAVPPAWDSSGDSPMALLCPWQHRGYTGPSAQVQHLHQELVRPLAPQHPSPPPVAAHTARGKRLQGAQDHGGEAKGGTDHTELVAGLRGQGGNRSRRAGGWFEGPKG